MTEPRHENEKPDVEAIIKELRANAQAAGQAVPDSLRSAVRDEDSLHEQLALANRSCMTGNTLPGWRKLFMKPLNPWRSEINTFNGSIVKVLNRLVKLLEGADLPESGPMIEQQRRRMTLTEKLNDRVAELERHQLNQRIKTLEDKIASLEKERKG
ncbi:MAG TPA: hypothetical protein PJ991_03000 [Kiritimatiellia bacterium]|nr:hypothetical protein [Kiritimatiellia bacterium]